MAPKKNKTPRKSAKPTKAKPAESEESSEDSSSETQEMEVEAPAVTKAKKNIISKFDNSKPIKDDFSESETKAPKKSVKPSKTKPVKPVEPEESSEDSSSESEEKEVTPKKSVKPTKAKPAKTKPAKPVEPEESSEDSSSESEEMEVEAPAVTKAKKLSKSKDSSAKEEEESSDSEEDEEESGEEEEDSDSEEEEEGEVVKKTAAAAAESDDSDEEEDSSEEESSEDDDDSPKSKAKGKTDGKQKDGAKDAKKRKMEAGSGKAAKKPKVDEPVTVMCRNVPQEVTAEKLEKFLKKKGIAFAAVRKRDDRMFAHIDLANPDDLDTVLAMKNIEFKGSTLAFEKGRLLGASKPERSKEEDLKSLFVKNLGFDDSEDSIRSNLTEIFPDARNIRIPYKGNSHRGFAYVEFDSAEDVKDAVEKKQGTECGHRKLFLDYAGGTPRHKKGFRDDQPEESNVLLVRNLSYDSTEDSLRSYFKDATDIRLPIFPDSGKPKGIAFVDFDSIPKAKSAMSKYDSTDIDGRTVRCCYARDRKDNDGRNGGSGGRHSGGRGRGGRRGGRQGGGYGGGRSSFGGGGKKKTYSDSD